MANTKITLANIADDAVGLDQLNISNSPSNGQALTYVATSNDLQWATVSGGVSGISSSADATAITIDSSENVQFSGNVGIGVAPTHNFNLQATGTVEARFRSTDGDCYLQISSDTDEGQDSVLEFTSGTSGRGRIIYDHNPTAASQKMIFKTGDVAVDAMTIDGAGFIGMGTTTPSSYNSYADNLVVADSAHCGISIVAGTTSQSTLMFADGTGGTAGYRGRVGYDHNTDSMVLHTAAAERLKIDSSGRVIVGSAGAIHFSGNSSTGFIYETGSNLQLRSDGAMTFYTYSGGWQVRMTIADGGLISGDFNDTSDVALKENIVAIDNGMSVISQMRPVSFDWRDVVAEDKDGNEVTVPSGKGSTKGLIAQEVEEIDEELVVGEEGEKAINTSGVLAYAIKAIQELKTELDAAKARIETLESN